MTCLFYHQWSFNKNIFHVIFIMNNYFLDIAGNKNAIYIRESGFNLYFSMTEYFLHISISCSRCTKGYWKHIVEGYHYLYSLLGIRWHLFFRLHSWMTLRFINFQFYNIIMQNTFLETLIKYCLTIKSIKIRHNQ